MRTVALDTSDTGDKTEVLTRIGAALDFPAHYGRNLDALADCLADLTGAVGLEWSGWETFQATDPTSFGKVLLVLDDHAESAAGFAVWLVADAD